MSLRAVLFAVPNGGKRSAIEAKIMMGEGVMPGVSDLILLTPRGKYASLCIELKTARGKLSLHQNAWGLEAERQGNAYIVVRSLQEFIEAVTLYLEGKPSAHIRLHNKYIKLNGTNRKDYRRATSSDGDRQSER